MHAEILKRRFGVCLSCRSDISTFGVQDNGDQRAETIRFLLYGTDDLFERVPPVRAEDLEEGGIGLEGCRITSRLPDEIQTKVPRGCSGGNSKIIDVWVQPDAEQRGAVIHTFFQKSEKGFHGCSIQGKQVHK